MKKLLALMAAAALVIAAVMIVNTVRLTSRQTMPRAWAGTAINERSAVDHLAGAIRLRTVTNDVEAKDGPNPWPAFHAYLIDAFPLIAQHLHKEVINGGSLLYTWPGRTPDLAPLILIGHMDVVPAADDTLNQWTHQPFDGVVADSTIWGRGSLDDKSAVLAIMESIEAMLANGAAPERTIYLGFGHDEEGGAASSGASAIAALLASRGVYDAVLVDEGGWIFEKIPGVAQHVALVGIAEKGFTSVELLVSGGGGHSSMPPRETAVGILAHAVDRAERNQMPGRLDGASAALFDTLAPEMSFGMKLLFANRWLTRPLLIQQLSKQPSTNASIRTTTAPTMLRASAKENVLASTAAAVLNFRLLPGDTQETVISHLREVIDDARVAIAPYHGQRGDEASRPSRTDTKEFAALAGAIRSVFPSVLVAPYLTVGATDARHYDKVASSLFRFVPIDQPGSTELLHAPNEHIEVPVYVKMIQAYGAIIAALAK